ncbi:(2Fe-2S)-binding protein [Fibrella arboris]|uniref:(2Fe-2S)-binding protein n=1 Tax=Fibrella arboris TaxID=3242486 RepID=UPI00352139A8
MNRYTFLKNLGFRGAALMAVLTSCVHEEDSYVPALTLNAQGQTITGPNGATISSSTSTSVSTPTSTTASSSDVLGIKNPLVTINLATTTGLKTVGGYVILSGIVIAKVSATTYAAVTQTCSHEPKKRVIFNNTEFYCTDHGARFNLDGTGKNSLAGSGIKAYKVITDGTTLVVYS